MQHPAKRTLDEFAELTEEELLVLRLKTRLVPEILIAREIDVDPKKIWHFLDRSTRKLIHKGVLPSGSTIRELRLLYMQVHAPDLFEETA